MTEINKLAHDLALQAASGAIDALSLDVTLDGKVWKDIAGDWNGQPIGSVLKTELRYLTLRGALAWHPEKPNLLRIKEVWS